MFPSEDITMENAYDFEIVSNGEEGENVTLVHSVMTDFYLLKAPHIFKEIQQTLERDMNTPFGKMLNQPRRYDRTTKCIICNVDLQLPDLHLFLEETYEVPLDVPLNRVHLIRCGHAFHHTCLVGLLIIGRAKYPSTWAACPNPTCRQPFDLEHNNGQLLVNRIWLDGTARPGDLMEYINHHSTEGLPIDRQCVADVIEFQKAIITGDYDLASSYLDSNGFLHHSGKIRGGLSVHSGLMDKENMLHWCAGAGDSEGVGFLLKKGADRSKRNIDGKSAWDLTYPMEGVSMETEGHRRCRKLLEG